MTTLHTVQVAHESSAPGQGHGRERLTRILELEDRITELAAHIDAATFRWLELVREYDESGGWAGPGLKSCAHWLNWKCGLALGTAREKLRVAHALKHLPRSSEAMRDGRLSYSKARALTRAATPDNEEVLLNVALCGTASHLERLVRHYRRVKRAEALQAERRRHDLRELNFHVDPDGSFILRGRFTAEQGMVIRQALEAVMGELYSERESVPAGTSEAETGPGLENRGEPGPQPVASRRADALVRMAEGWLGGSSCAGARGDRFTINLHTDADTLREDGCGATAELEDAPDVPAETARRLSCDAAVIRWLEDSDGEPISVERKTRSIPPAIRRALQRRDGGCRFPGCTATRFVDAHHIHHWADGGETAMPNLALLCRHHHRLVHEGGFGLQRRHDGSLEFTTPAGQPIPEVPKRRSRGNVLHLIDQNARNGIVITPKTPIPHWYGESLDVDTAMRGLLQRE